MQNLGTIDGGKYSDAYGINDLGQVVGYSTISADGPQHGFIYDSVNGMQDLGTLGGDTSDAWAINNAGQVVAYADTVHSFGIPHAFLWDSVNGMQDLGTLGGPLSYGYGLNEAGDTTGSSLTSDGFLHAFLDIGGVISDVGTLPGGNYSQGWAVNSSDQVVGYATVNNDQNYHAFVWASVNGMQDLGTLGGDNRIAYSVDSDGDVVGLSETTPGHPASRPFLYQNGVMTDLTTLLPVGSDWHLLLARTITDNGLVVGVGRHGSSLNYHAFLMDLNASDPGTLAAGAALQATAVRAQPVLGDSLTNNPLAERLVMATTTEPVTAPATQAATRVAFSLIIHVQESATGAPLDGQLGTEGLLNI
jgi:probable HAF family extracellular repeat protein